LITLIIADDDPVILTGLSMIIGANDKLEIVGTACNGAEAAERCRALKPDVALLDIRMPEMDGIAAAEIILRENLSLPLLLTTFDEPEFINRALNVGAMGYILKNSPAERIISAIITVANGGTVFSPDILAHIRAGAKPVRSDIWETLTAREFEIVKLISEGFSNAEIAEKLYISNGTARNYISVILDKMSLEHRTQLAVKYLSGA
jgi:DNA-binding NarL/FixJ family response regulator